MGRKVHPYGFRLGVINDWRARWFAEGREYSSLLKEDLQIRDLIRMDQSLELYKAGIGEVEIERYPNSITVLIRTAKPGIVIGRKGSKVNQLRDRIQAMTGKKVKVEVAEIEKPELDAYLVAESIVQQIERRISHKRAMKQAVTRAMRLGAQGLMIATSGRLAGSEMARYETVREGRVPRHTLRADIDYAQTEALTTYGRIGVKVWIYKGEILPGDSRKEVGRVVEY